MQFKSIMSCFLLDLPGLTLQIIINLCLSINCILHPIIQPAISSHEVDYFTGMCLLYQSYIRASF